MWGMLNRPRLQHRSISGFWSFDWLHTHDKGVLESFFPPKGIGKPSLENVVTNILLCKDFKSRYESYAQDFE